MGKALDDYKAMEQALLQKFTDTNTDHTRDAWVYQEVSYRIHVLESLRALSMTAPEGMDSHQLFAHFTWVDAFITFMAGERLYAPSQDPDERKRQETAMKTLQEIIASAKGKFRNYAPASPKQYRQDITTLIKVIIPPWMQYRDTYFKLDRTKEA